MRRASHYPARFLNKGAALIEALVAMLIVSIGVLGMVGLQAGMTRAQSAAKHRADAAYLTSEIVGAMWIDRSNLASYATTPGTACSYQRCSDWVRKVASGLPHGEVELSVTPSTGAVSLTTTWSMVNEGTHTYAISTTVR